METAVVEAPEILSGTITIMQTVKGMFPPNTIFYALENEDARKVMVDRDIVEEAA